MFSIIGTIIGFLGSLIPNLLKLWQDKKDKAHEISLLNIQIEREKLGHTYKMEEINVQADISETEALYKTLKPVGVKWVDALIGTVRPVITYSFFTLYAVVKFFQYRSYGPSHDVFSLWTDADMAIFCTIIAFWFGSRTFQKLYKR